MTYPLTIAGCCRELLDDSSPKTLAELAKHVVAEGRSQARYPEMSVSSTLSREERVFRVGDIFHSVPMLLEGRVLTTAQSTPEAVWRRSHSWLRCSDPWFFDLAAFPSETGANDLPKPTIGAGEVCAWRLREGEFTVEVLPRDDLVDASPLVEAVRREVPGAAGHGHALRREVLLACLADDSLLREPVLPLSELFPEYAPRPPEPVPSRTDRRRCRACDGSGWQYGWDEPYDDDWSYDSDPPLDWRRRIERLEEATFGSGDASLAGGSTAVVPLGLWPES